MYSAARASHEIELILLASEDELPDDSRHLLDIDLNTVRKRLFLFEEQENYVYVYVAKAACPCRAGQHLDLAHH